jgi:hypothetical protein
MSIEERLQHTRVTVDWIPMSPFDSRKVEALSRLADAEAAIEAANRALDAASAALERPPSESTIDGGEHVLREPIHPRSSATVRGEFYRGAP